MDAGKLDRKISLAHRVVTVLPSGEKASTWPVDYISVWAEVTDVSAREFIAGGGMVADRVVQFRIRWRADVLMTDQITFESVAYNIGYISEIGRHEGLEITATATAL